MPKPKIPKAALKAFRKEGPAGFPKLVKAVSKMKWKRNRSAQASDAVEGVMQQIKSYSYQSVTVAIDANEFLTLLRDHSWDRPSAFYEIAGWMKIEEPRELFMHAPPNIKISQDIGIDTAQIQAEAKAFIEEMDYLDRVFKGNIPPVLLDDGWDT